MEMKSNGHGYRMRFSFEPVWVSRKPVFLEPARNQNVRDWWARGTALLLRALGGAALAALLSCYLMVSVAASSAEAAGVLRGQVATGDEWLIQAETFLKQRRILDAVPDDPSAPISPNDWNAMVSEVFGLAPGDDGVAGSPRNVVSASTDGLAEGSKITRAAAIHGLVRVLDVYGVIAQGSGVAETEGGGRGTEFADWGEVPPKFKAGVGTALKMGLVNGYPGGRLEPNAPLTIGEGLALLHRVCDTYKLLDRLLVPQLSTVNKASIVEDGIRITIYTDKPEYVTGDAVSVVAAVENQGQAIAYRLPYHGAAAVSLRATRLERDARGFARVYRIGEDETISPIKEGEIELRLNPGTTILRRDTWIPPFVQKEEGTVEYSVEALIRVVRPKGFGWQASRPPIEDLRARVNIRVRSFQPSQAPGRGAPEVVKARWQEVPKPVSTS